MATIAYRSPFPGDSKKSPRRLLAVAVCLCLLLFVPLCAMAQNNPYKINDRLYGMYRKAYERRMFADGHELAADMYREAVALGDGKAQCLALSVTMFYYYYKLDDYAGFQRAVKAMQDKALETGFRQYYYFGITNTVNYLLLRKRRLEALEYVQRIERESRKGNDMLGLFYGLNSLAQVHHERMEYGVALKALGEAIEVARKFLPSQDLSTIRLKQVRCYSDMFDYPNMYAAAEDGLRGARTSSSRIRFLSLMAFAALKQGQYDRVRQCYDRYLEIGNVRLDSTSEMSKVNLMIVANIAEKNFADAQATLAEYPAGYGISKLRLQMALYERMGDYARLAEQKNRFYNSWLQIKDSYLSSEVASLGADFFNQKLEMENQRLALDRQRMLNERQRTEISNSNLELANTQLSLRNSDLELYRTRSAADIMRLSYDRKRLEAERLRGQVAAQHTQTEFHRTLLFVFLIIAAIIAVAVIAYLANHRRMMRRLNRANTLLEERHRQLAEEKERAEAANRAKTAFIQSMGEEIRQPLYSAVSCARTIANSAHANSAHSRASQTELGEYNATLQKSTSDMLRLVATVLKKAQGGLCLCLLLSMPLCAVAQNNPYKINDRLYKIYAEAAQKELSDESLVLADRMYREALAIGDGKAQCLARSVTMFHYYYTMRDDAAFERSVKAMQDEALRTGYRQYYYFGFTNRINYRLNTKRDREALTLAQELVDKLRRANDNYGLFYALNALGSVHLSRNEIRIAINDFNKALEVGRKYAPDQDMATIYRKLVECHISVYDYQKAYDMARLGYEVGKTRAIRLRLIHRMAFAQLKLGNYEKTGELCQQYIKVRGGADTTRNMTEEDNEMRIIHCIVDERYGEADSLIRRMNDYLGTRRLRLHIALYERGKVWDKMASESARYYGLRIANQDSMNLQDVAGISADLYNMKTLIDHRRLETERQRIANERQRTEIVNTNLELSNTRLSLSNSSLELGRTRADADRLRLAANNKRLEAARLRGQVEAQKAQAGFHRTLLMAFLIVAAVIAIAVVLYLCNHRRMMRRLNRANTLLEERHRQLAEEKERAEAANRAKTAFIQSMGEEIRQPLYSAVSCARTIANSAHSRAPQSELDEYNATLQKSTSDMLRLVATVLKKAQGGLCLCLLLFMPLCAVAQNNPYKINDRLYPLYREAYGKRHSPQGLPLAERLYGDAGRLGDKKAKCLALTIPMLYYFDLMGSDNEAAFVRAVEVLQKEALASGFRQYYYFGLTNRVNYLLNRMRDSEALDMAQEFEGIARRNNDMYGVFYGLNSIAQVHIQRHEVTLAINALNEALEVGTEHLRDQDMGTIYRKLAQCYSLLFYYQKQYDTASRGYSVARSNAARQALIYHMAFAQLKMQNYDRVDELYSLFERVNGKPDTTHMSMFERSMLIMKCIADRNEKRAVELLEGMSKINRDIQDRLIIEVHRRNGNYRGLANFRQFYYDTYLTRQDSMQSGAMLGLVSRIYNSRLELDNRALIIERQRAANESRRLDIYNTSLELSNTELSLRNSSLELGRARAGADSLRLASDNKRLEAAKLRSRIDEARAHHEALHVKVGAAGMAFVVLLVAGLMILRAYRRANRRLYGIHSQLVATHSELKEAHSRAVAADNAKTALLQAMTADINIPLNSITGFARLIADPAEARTPDERRECFRQISAGTRSMLDIVKNVLEKVQGDKGVG